MATLNKAQKKVAYSDVNNCYSHYVYTKHKH